jgi:hypothetical protein
VIDSLNALTGSSMVIGLTKFGAVLNTESPVPVSSVKILASCAEVVGANELRGATDSPFLTNVETVALVE